jgi:hypothetical protein
VSRERLMQGLAEQGREVQGLQQWIRSPATFLISVLCGK